MRLPTWKQLDIARSKDLAQDGCGSEAERSFRTRIRTEPITPWLRPGRSLSQSLSPTQRANALLLALTGGASATGIELFSELSDPYPQTKYTVGQLQTSYHKLSNDGC